jgi:hypothetical protein
MNSPLFRKAALGALAVIATVWGSLAAGSYVYLAQMGYSDDFAFPWNQLIVALPYVLSDPWNGWVTINIWKCALFGIVAMIAPSVIVVGAIGFHIAFGRTVTGSSSLFGESSFADRKQMRRGGIKTSRTLQ